MLLFVLVKSCRDYELIVTIGGLAADADKVDLTVPPSVTVKRPFHCRLLLPSSKKMYVLHAVANRTFVVVFVCVCVVGMMSQCVRPSYKLLT